MRGASAGTRHALLSTALPALKIVVFTGQDVTGSPWWPILLASCTVDEVLIVRQTVSSAPADVWRRFRRNVQRHGWTFVPYRAGLLALSLLPRRRRAIGLDFLEPEVAKVPIEWVDAQNIHAPEVLERVAAWGPDLGVSLGAPLLRRALFGIPQRGTLNLHLGAVPEFRGAPPAFWELHFGAAEIGATVHWVDDGLDTGRVIAEGRAPIYEADGLADVERRAQELGKLVLADALARTARGDGEGTPQRPGGRTNRFPTLAQRRELALRLLRRRVRLVLAPRRVAKAAAAALLLGAVRPLRDAWRTLRRRHPVRVFTFHRVTDLCRDGMTVSPALFAEQVDYIARHHDMVPLGEAVRLATSGAPLRRPAAAITFDDAYRSVARHAAPVLRAMGVPGACFVSTSLVGEGSRFAHDDACPVRHWVDVMGWDEIAALRAEGWEIGGHTATHARLAHCSAEELEVELRVPVAVLRERLALESPVMSYPFGGRDDVPPGLCDTLGGYGYRACLSNFGGENLGAVDPFHIRRIDVGGDHVRGAWRSWVHGFTLRPQQPTRPAQRTLASRPSPVGA